MNLTDWFILFGVIVAANIVSVALIMKVVVKVVVP